MLTGRALFINPNKADEKMVYLRVMNYRDSNAIFIVLVSPDKKNVGVPSQAITTRPDKDLPPFHGAISLENKAVVQMLVEQGVCETTDQIVYAGFKALYVVSFEKEVLMEYDRQGTEQYECQIDARKTEDAACIQT